MRVAHSDNNSELFTNISSYPPLTCLLVTLSVSVQEGNRNT